MVQWNRLGAFVQCCFTSTETIRDGDPRTVTSTLTQLLGTVGRVRLLLEVMLNHVLGCRLTY